MPQPLMVQGVRNIPNHRPGQIPRNITNSLEGYTRNVQDNELAQTHLNNMLNREGQYLRRARAGGEQRANQLGMGLTSLAGAYAEDAAIGAAAPIAMADAQAYGRAASENLDSLAQQRMAMERNETDITTTDMNVGGQLASNQMRIDFEREDNAADRLWRTSERESGQTYEQGRDERQFGHDRDMFDRGVGAQRDADRRSFRSQLHARIMSTILDNPTYMRDPVGARGMIEYFNGPEFDNLFNTIFGGP